jgi:hypothetical protein
MNIPKKKALLLATLMLVIISGAIIAFAQSSGIAKEKGLIRPFIGQGFALNPSNATDYHVLDISAMHMNRYNDQMATGAHLIFAGQAYIVNITSYDNTSLNGDIMTLPPRGTNKTSFNPTLVGHITLSMSQKEGVMFSTGTLTMNGTNYNAILTSPVRASWRGQPGGMFGKGGFFGTHGFKR